MKRSLKLNFARAAMIFAAWSGASLVAQESTGAKASGSYAEKTPVASTGLLNNWLRSQTSAFTDWDIGGQFRARLEYRDHFGITGVANSVDFRDDNVDTENVYLLLREKIHLGYAPVPWLAAFVEGRDSSAQSDDRHPSSDSDSFDLHQAYLSLGSPEQFPLAAKLGRQELSYGDERLIGISDWSNTGRTFDAAKLRFQNDALWLDGFIGRVIIPRDDHFNVANDYDWFYGVYASTKALCPKQVTEFYFLGRNASRQSPNAIGNNQPSSRQGASPRDIYTFGLRFKSLTDALGGWDYDGEIAGQLGDFAFTGGSRLDHEAFASHIGGGYTWKKVFGTPRLGFEYNYASGDSDPNDNQHETFDTLFATGHKHFGSIDLFCWQNIHDIRIVSSLKPHKQLTLTLDYNALWLANTHDYLYQANTQPRQSGGYGIHPNYGSYVGSEVNLVATWAIKPFAIAQAGYAHFFRGDYIKQTLATVGSADADFVYGQLVFNF